MKRICSFTVLFFVLAASAYAQNLTSYYEIPIRSKATGKLVSGLNVDLYQDGVKIYDLTESASAPGTYYHATVATGEYDIYVNGSVFRSGVFIGANKLSIIQENFNSVGHLQNSAVDALLDSLVAHELLLLETYTYLDSSISNAKLATNFLEWLGSTNIRDSVITISNLSTALIDYIDAGGGGSITNNPDDNTLETVAGSQIAIKSTWKDSIRTSSDRRSLGRHYSSVSNMVSTIGTSEIWEVVLTDTLTASSDIVIPDNILMTFRGGFIRVSAGVTVTVNYESISHNGNKKLFILDNANTAKVNVNTVNVGHFGAVGDSSTNSFDALHAASLQVRDGATLLVPGGEYRAGGPLYSGGTAWERDSTNSIIWLYGKKNVNVVFEQGASISINDSARTMGINAKQCTTMVIDNAKFYGPAKNGYVQESYVITHPMIFIQGGYSIRVNNPWTEGSHSFGIFVTYTYKHDKPWSTNGNDGGERRPTRDVIINNLTAINCGTDKINDGHNVVVEGINLTVNGGYIRRARGRGIEIFATDPAAGAAVDGVTIRGVKIRDVDRDGIATFAVEDSVLERYRNITIENCDLDSVGLTDGGAISITALSPGTPMEGGVIIRNNVIRNNGINVRAIRKSLIYGNRLVNGSIVLRNHGKEWWDVYANVVDSTQRKILYLNNDGSDYDTGYFNVWGNTFHNANLSGATEAYNDCAIQIEYYSTARIVGNDFSKNDSLSKVIYYSGAKAQYIANNIMPSGMSKADFFKLNAAIEDTLRLTNFNNRNAEYESANFVNFFTIDSSDWDFYQKDSLRLGEMRLVINDNPQWNGEPYRALMFRERNSLEHSDLFMLPGEWSYYDYEFPRTTSTIFLLTFRNGNLRNSYFHPGALSMTGGKRWFDFEDVEAGTTTFAEGNAYGSYAAVFDSTNFIMTKTAGVALSGANLPTGDFTLELRVFMTAANGAESALRYLTVKNGGSNMSISANTGSGWLPTATVTDQSANSRAVTSGVDIADDAWHLITLSHDQDGYTRLYIDQVAQDSSNTALSSNVMINNSELSLGGWVVGANARFFEGKISDVRLLNESITY